MKDDIRNDNVGIYKITSPSGKIYIGQSWNVFRRFQQYHSLDCKFQTRLHRSFEKYGVFEHKFEVIHTLYSEIHNQVDMDEFEQQYMDFYVKSGFELLNLRAGGSHGKLSEETKRKIGDGVRGEKNGNYGRKFTQEHILKLSESKKGSPGYWTGKKLKQETIEKMKKSKIGVNAGKNHYLYGKKRDRSVCEKIRRTKLEGRIKTI